ncbi:MAG: hypothetical protein LUC16_03015 [Coprobacillus sp.]|nr:hypothetical protein [Coprobacillus sp.]
MEDEEKKEIEEESSEGEELEILYDENGEQIVDEEKINEEMKKAKYDWARIVPIIVIAVLLVACIIALVIVNTGE